MDRLETDLFTAAQVTDMINLHSSMDRLETEERIERICAFLEFTFQYGQIRNDTILDMHSKSEAIYIPVWIDQKQSFLNSFFTNNANLHSSMDRLETNFPLRRFDAKGKFTFQYGQIRNQ